MTLSDKHRKWFMLALGPEQMHKMLDGFDDKTTTAVCTFAYCEGPGHEPIIFQGKTEVRKHCLLLYRLNFG
jgi:inosine/xanthosine triphosphate pyrophosphatase family protein